jgi:hypothetical protein
MASLLSGDSSIKEASQQIAWLDLILQVPTSGCPIVSAVNRRWPGTGRGAPNKKSRRSSAALESDWRPQGDSIVDAGETGISDTPFTLNDEARSLFT